MDILLDKVFDSRSIILDLKGTTKEEVLSELANAITSVHPHYENTVILSSIMEREKKLSTGIGSGVAISHAFCAGIKDMVGAIGISQTGIEYDAIDQKLVNIVFMLLMGGNVHENHLRILNHLFTLTQLETIEMIKNAKNSQNIKDILMSSGNLTYMENASGIL